MVRASTLGTIGPPFIALNQPGTSKCSGLHGGGTRSGSIGGSDGSIGGGDGGIGGGDGCIRSCLGRLGCNASRGESRAFCYHVFV